MSGTADRMIASALGAVQRRAEQNAAEAADYGRLVERNRFGRYFERMSEDGRIVSTLVYDTPGGGSVAYQLISVSLSDLV